MTGTNAKRATVRGSRVVLIAACLVIAIHVAHGGSQFARKMTTAWREYSSFDEIVSTQYRFGCASASCEICLDNIKKNPQQITFAGNSSQYEGVDIKILERHTNSPLQQCYKGSSFIDQWSDRLGDQVRNMPGQSIYYGYALWEFLWESIPLEETKSIRFMDVLESEFSGTQWNYRDRLMGLGVPYNLLNGFVSSDQELPALADILKRQSYYKFRRDSDGIKSDREVESTVRKFIESMGTIKSIVLYRAPDLEEVAYFEIPPARTKEVEGIIRRVVDEYANARHITLSNDLCGIGINDFWHPRALDLDVNHINQSGRVKYTKCLLPKLSGDGIFK
jgi:hypothetical protein